MDQVYVLVESEVCVSSEVSYLGHKCVWVRGKTYGLLHYLQRCVCVCVCHTSISVLEVCVSVPETGFAGLACPWLG